MPPSNDPPGILADLLLERRRVQLHCRSCGYKCFVQPHQLKQPRETLVSDIGRSMMCPDCYGRSIHSTRAIARRINRFLTTWGRGIAGPGLLK